MESQKKKLQRRAERWTPVVIITGLNLVNYLTDSKEINYVMETFFIQLRRRGIKREVALRKML